MVIVAPWFIIGKHAIKQMKTYAAVNIWLAFIYVPNPFQLKPRWSLRERLRAVINCLYTLLIKGLNWIQGKHCFFKPVIFTYLQHWDLMQLKTAHVTQWTLKVFLRHYMAVHIDLSPLFKLRRQFAICAFGETDLMWYRFTAAHISLLFTQPRV